MPKPKVDIKMIVNNPHALAKLSDDELPAVFLYQDEDGWTLLGDAAYYCSREKYKNTHAPIVAALQRLLRAVPVVALRTFFSKKALKPSLLKLKKCMRNISTSDNDRCKEALCLLINSRYRQAQADIFLPTTYLLH